MSNEIQNASLADRARALAVEMVGGAAEVNLALAAADSVKGIVITDEATSRQVADTAKVLVRGRRRSRRPRSAFSVQSRRPRRR